jgi:fatty-acid desaturase
MIKMSPYYQTLWVVWGNHLLTILAMLFFFEWWMIPVAFASGHLFSIFSEIGIHRYFTHRAFKVESRWKEHLMKVFAFLTGQGAILSWVTVHRHHHLYEDKPGDPHSPILFPWWKIYLGLFPKTYEKNLVTDLIRHKDRRYFVFENNYYWIMWTLLWIVSFAIHPVLFFVIASGSAVWYAFTSIVNVCLHSRMIGHVDHPDHVASNSGWLNWLTGVGYHNNHHKNPVSYTYNLDGTDRDWIGAIIKHTIADTLVVEPKGQQR